MIGEIGITIGIPKTIYVITWSWMGETKVVASTSRREAEAYFDQMAQSSTLRVQWREYDVREEYSE